VTQAIRSAFFALLSSSGDGGLRNFSMVGLACGLALVARRSANAPAATERCIRTSGKAGRLCEGPAPKDTRVSGVRLTGRFPHTILPRMSHPSVRPPVRPSDFTALAARQRRIALTLTGAMLVLYF